MDVPLREALGDEGLVELILRMDLRRLQMEVAALFERGSAVASMRLLWNLKLLDCLLPLHAEHLEQHGVPRDLRCAHCWNPIQHMSAPRTYRNHLFATARLFQNPKADVMCIHTRCATYARDQVPDALHLHPVSRCLPSTCTNTPSPETSAAPVSATQPTHHCRFCLHRTCCLNPQTSM